MFFEENLTLAGLLAMTNFHFGSHFDRTLNDLQYMDVTSKHFYIYWGTYAGITKRTQTKQPKLFTEKKSIIVGVEQK